MFTKLKRVPSHHHRNSSIYKKLQIFLKWRIYSCIQCFSWGSQCQTSSLEKHSSHFESIMSLFKLSPHPTKPCPAALFNFKRLTEWTWDWKKLMQEIILQNLCFGVFSIAQWPNSLKCCRSLFDRHLLGNKKKLTAGVLFCQTSSPFYFTLLF